MVVRARDPQRVLLAGGTGALGRRLVPALVAAGHDVHVLARSRAAGAVAGELGARPVEGDLLDREAVFAAAAEVRPTVVLHAASALRTDVGSYALTNRLRTEGSRHLVDAAERVCAQRVIGVSVAFAYRPSGPAVVDEEHPLDLAAAEPVWRGVVDALARLEDTTMEAQQAVAVVLRLGALYGPATAYAADGAIAGLVRRRRLPLAGHARGLTSFVHVDDAAAAVLSALHRGWGIYNVVDDAPAPAADWIPALARRYGAPPPRRVPARLYRPRAGYVARLSMAAARGADNGKARRTLEWVPARPDWSVAFMTEEGW